jgi:tetratricopeptide (TPR) repeat protein
VFLDALRQCARSPGFWFWTLAQVLAAALCAAVPISARPGYESALVIAPVAGAASGFLAVLTVARRRDAGLGQLLVRVLASVLPGPALALLVLVIAASARGFCDPVQGLGFFAVGPLGSALTGAGLGTFTALLVPGRRLPHVAWAAVPVAFLAWDALLVYATPQVFVFDHLLGTFGGPLYDEAVGVGIGHIAFRTVTLIRLAPLIGLAAALLDPSRARLDPSRLRRPAALASLAALALARVLGGTTVTPHVTIHHPEELTRRQTELLAAEVELRFDELGGFFGEEPGHIEISMFRSSGEMRLLTGTGPTNVAKPWLGAAFMVYEPFPHPVLKHEMAHLFAAVSGRGPFRMPGPLWGMLADPLILEGTAVAADWDGDPLDPHTRSAAILEAGLIEDPSSLAGLVGFYTHQGGLAYDMSGSFVRRLWSHHGPAAVRAWYSGATFEQAFGTSMEEALASWERDLRAIDVPDEWVESLRRRYSRGSVFARPCPHQVALLMRDAARAGLDGDLDGSVAVLDRICSIAPADAGLRIVRLRALARLPSLDRARSELASLEANAQDLGGYQPTVSEIAGDVAWLRGDAGAAAERYSEALAMTVEDAPRRMLVVKRWATSHPSSAALRGYLLGTPEGPAGDPDTGIALITSLAGKEPADPLLEYLLGRALYNARRWTRAAEALDRATKAGIDEPVIAGEALRLLASARLWAGEPDAALEALDRLDEMPPASPALGYHARELRALIEVAR